MAAIPSRVARRSLVRGQVLGERIRARLLRFQLPGTIVHPRAQLGRGSRVYVAEGGTLTLGPGTISENVTIRVGPAGSMALNGAYIGPCSVLVARKSVVVEEGAMIAEMCVLRDSDHLRDSDGSISRDRYTSEPVEVQRNAWLGAGVTILKGVVIGAGSTIGAGAVVTHSIGPGAVAHGVPARVVTTVPPAVDPHPTRLISPAN